MFAVIRFSDLLDKLSFALFCAYMSGISLGYVSPAFTQLHSIVLYAFVGVSALNVLVSRKFIFTGYMKAYGAFMLLALLSCLYSPNLNTSFEALYRIFVCFTLCFCATACVNSEERIKTVFKAFSISAFILMLILMIRGDIDFSANLLYGDRFGSSVTGNANSFSNTYMFGAVFSAYFIAYSKNLRQKIVYTIVFAVQLLAQIVAGGRKYIIITVLIFWLINFFKSDKRNRKHYLKQSIIGVTIFLVLIWAFMNIPFLYYNIGYRFEAAINGVENDTSMYLRTLMIKEGLLGWVQKPFLGNGVATFKAITSFNVYSHNNYVEVLFGMGIIGFAIYYGYSIIIMSKLFKSTKTDSIRWILLLLCFAMFIYDFGAISYDSPINQLLLALGSRFLIMKEPSPETLRRANSRLLILHAPRRTG